jgi:hypothetical protein
MGMVEPGPGVGGDGTAGSRLDPDTPLQRVPDVTLSLSGAGTVRVRVASGEVDCGHLGLRILERFGRPTTLREFASERAVGAQEWVDLLEAARSLVASGILVDPREPTGANRRAAGYWWDDPRPHIEMLNDVERTSRYIEAIERTVRPGDTVLDIGTGTGVLAMAAARAGAGRVFAVEAGAVAGKAEEIVAANGLGSVITVLRGWSTSVTLPTPADVLVTETLGSDPFNERILETVIDARTRLLAPEARIVPARLSLRAVAVEVPEEHVSDWIFTSEGCRRWRATYGFDFGLLTAHERWVHGVRVPMATARGWRRLAPPVELVELDLHEVDSPVLGSTVRVRTTDSGRLDGAFSFFVAELGHGISLSTDPHADDGDRHWWNVLHLRPPADVDPSTLLALSYGRRSRLVAPGLAVTLADPAS